MRVKNIVVVVAAATLCFSVGVWAGNPTPDNPPGSTAAYTLEDLWQRLTTGAAGTESTFTEPAAGPGTGTMHTLNEIMAAAPALDDTDGAAPDDVLAGKTYWGVTTGEWGMQTGELHDGGCTCAGTLHETRWCDNEDGTVTDLITCLVWLQKADWGGQKPWRNSSTDCSFPDFTCYDDAHMRAGLLYAGATGANLSDGSEVGDWRLPTLTELKGLVNGSPALRCVDSPCDLYGFTGIQPNYYWSSTTRAAVPSYANLVTLSSGFANLYNKAHNGYVWPVRGGE